MLVDLPVFAHPPAPGPAVVAQAPVGVRERDVLSEPKPWRDAIE